MVRQTRQEHNTNLYAVLPIAVVIPALNAAAMLPRTLAALGPVSERVIVDGGSADGTVSVAESLGARVVRAPRGRGGQIAAGIAATRAPWLLLLHADTLLSPDWRQAAAAHMARDPDKAAWFRFALDSGAPQARRLERAVAWRCRWLGLPYGDQGLLIHRDLLNAVGGMRALPLMEDVDLVRRLGRHRLCGLPAAAITSAAKWERDGWYRRSARNLFCLALWYAGVSPRVIVGIYG
jgi:rSAM/selenodomain-associated transferase 2